MTLQRSQLVHALIYVRIKCQTLRDGQHVRPSVSYNTAQNQPAELPKAYLHHTAKQGRLGCLALAGGPVGPPARWAATSNVVGGSGIEDGERGSLAEEGGLSLDILFAGPPSS